MEVAFAGGAFAEVAGYYPLWDVWVLERLELERVGCAGGLRDLGGEGGGDGVLVRVRKGHFFFWWQDG